MELTADLAVVDVLDVFDVPAFVLGPDRTVLAWNRGIENLMGMSREDLVGTVGVGRAGYDDPEAQLTLADKVVLEPERAHRVYDDVSLADPEFTLLNTEEYVVYEDTSVVEGADGEDREIWFSAAPIYEGDALVGVLEIVQDRADSLRHQTEVRALVEGQTDKLGDSVAETVESTRVIQREMREQSSSLSTVRREMEGLSANMQEVAASSAQVASAAAHAEEAVAAGVESGREARRASTVAVETGDDLVETVAELGARMDAIGGVVEVIAEVADQTNLLALNANIEAARAGEAGAGFEVVADEVKSLANETRTHTRTIGEQVEAIQAQTGETVVAVEESSGYVRDGAARMRGTLDSLDELSSAVGEAAAGIDEVATANDEQAATVEEVTAEIEAVMARADEVGDATERIVAETEAEREAVAELSARIRELTTT